MDETFFTELEAKISNVGADEYWKRTVGGREVWFSPITAHGQAKVQEMLTKSDFAGNALNETKRVTLSHAITGIDNIDLSQYRHAPPAFGPMLISGKNLKVDLHTYLYHKLAHWGQQFIDDCFDIYADLMETHQRNNLKDVKFENSKNPHDELAELMVRVTELRTRLDLSPLVEGKSTSETQEEELAPEPELDEAEEYKRIQKSAQEQSFDPFRTVPKPVSAPIEPPVTPQPILSKPPVVTVPIPKPPNPVRTSTEASYASRASEIAELEGHQQSQMSSPTNPIAITPQQGNVVEQPAAKSSVPVMIDHVPQNRNPRFAPQRR